MVWMTSAPRWDCCSESVIFNPSSLVIALFLSKDLSLLISLFLLKDYQTDPRTVRFRFDTFERFEMSFDAFRHRGASVGSPHFLHDTTVHQLAATRMKFK